DEVIGIDMLTDYYNPALKERNLMPLRNWNSFSFHRVDLVDAPLSLLLDGAEVIYHLAGQPGVRSSWDHDFPQYVTRNVLATHAMLEAARRRPMRKMVFASSSSIYGEVETYPTVETLRPQPASPYGVTKLAAEHLCELYRTTSDVPTVSLRLFSVYGPRQRPDMAFSRLLAAITHDRPFHLYGDGEQTRDFTYASDVVAAMRAAAYSEFTGVANIGGGNQVSMNQVIATIEQIAGPVQLVRLPVAHGEVRHTGADITLARTAFGYTPTVGLTDGIAAMVEAERRTSRKHGLSRELL
ncbi:MAG TPA: NAD-dependent epimerase/dehydratase family protein, partial [Pseudonocardiaceae bacterium]|nr:NAD-dependent epimerase/dehydratase family protein [Pseudonocardiaceae bacterium]